MGEGIKITKVVYPEKFEGSYVNAHEEFNDELKKIIGKSGEQKIFLKRHRNSLKILEKYRTNCTLHNNFEELKKTNALFSMRLKGRMNIRILFAFFTVRGKEKAILLYSFQEKNDKKQSKNSYSTAIPIANKRRIEIKSLLNE